jgi:hypothetical protein
LTLWTAGDNAELRAKRKNPNILFAGDVVVIPDTTSKQADAAARVRRLRRHERADRSAGALRAAALSDEPD